MCKNLCLDRFEAVCLEHLPRELLEGCAANHAGVHVITRPALSDERVQCNAAGQVDYKLKTRSRNGTAHLVLLRHGSAPSDESNAHHY
jgi:hypothetical protein